MSISVSPLGLHAARLAKTRAMANFVRTRFRISDMLNDEEIVIKAEMKQLRESLDDDFQKAMDTLENLVSLTDDADSKDRVQAEMEKLLNDYAETLESAGQYGSNSDRFSDTYSVRSVGQSYDHAGAVPTITEVGRNDCQPSSNSRIEQDMWRQLKRVSIPVFSGNKQTYENWKAAFTACVDKSPSSAEYKLLQLRQYLSGDALKAVANLGHSAAAYEAAKERLDRKFGGSRRHIAAQMEEVDNFRPVRPGNATDIDKFADLVDVVVINLKESNRCDELGYGSLYFKLLKKLPQCMIRDYQRWIFENRRQEVVESLKDWINQESQFQTIASETVKGLSSDQNANFTGGNRRRREQTMFIRVNQFTCPCCHEQHGVWKCSEFKRLDVPARWQFAKDKKLCFRCLGSSHVGQSCTRSRNCGLNGCTQLHHRLLHKVQGNTVTASDSAVSNRASASYPAEVIQPVPPMSAEGGAVSSVPLGNVTMITKEMPESLIALRTVAVVLKNGDKSIRVNALLDDGSTKTYLNSDVAAELGLVGKSERITVGVLNGQYEVFDTMPVEVTLQSVDGTLSQCIVALTTDKVTGNLKAVDWKRHSSQWPHLQGIEFPKLGSRSTIDLLIGIDYADLHSSCTEILGQPGQPIARLTPLGWTCIGNLFPDGSAPKHCGFFHAYFLNTAGDADHADINMSLRKFWEVEHVPGTDTVVSTEDRVVIENMRQSLNYKDGRYEVNIPWKDGTPSLPNNYAMAVRRLENTERRLDRSAEVKTSYQSTICQYLDKGYIHKVAELSQNNEGWYLPHFPIVRPDKSTTKVRIVFDASATFKGMSLNQSIHQGPKLQRELSDVLLRFRKNPVALICDISEMYLQIRITPADRCFFRFLWRDLHTDQLPEVYEFERVVFGVNCSPFLAQFVAQEHARRLSAEFPAAAETLLKSTYMDDSMDSVVSSQDGIELYRQLTALWKLAGMTTRKWLSNSEEVLNSIPYEDQAAEVDIDGGELYGTKTLGVLWLAQQDLFTFRFKPTVIDAVFTKRSFLQKVAKVFDPLGFLAPYVIRAKMLLQKVWASGTDWDEPLTPELHEEACQWFSELSAVAQIYVPRCIRSSDTEGLESIELHVFGDASADAYGTVAYTRCLYASGNVSCHFVCAKTKVAPLESFSIPRLELMAALLALRLGLSVAGALNIESSQVTFWSDSMNVLCWIRSRSRAYKPFVANRIGEIQRLTNPNQWKYVPTKQNPADKASRGIAVSKLACDSLWWNGPEYLMLPSDQWPNRPDENVEGVRDEVKRCVRNAVTLLTSSDVTSKSVPLIDDNRYSSWIHMIRVHSWILRFIHNCRGPKQNRLSGELTSDELMDSEVVVIKACQQDAFTEEYKALVQKKALSRNSRLLVVNPCLDEDGLIRSNSRLANVEHLSFDARYPIILPRRSYVTRLIVKHAHEKGSHITGTNGTLAELSKKYWILSAREAIRELEQSCMKCKRRSAKAATQLMAPLPSSRVQMPKSLRAFTHTAVDFAGPFTTIQGRGRTRAKRYLCLFTCMATRAVHLEMAYGLDTDSFLKAFYRFVNRRGPPVQMTSDNGTNFVGANRELQQLVSQLDKSKIQKGTAHDGMRWNFNPPAGPHFGGVYEIMIKAAKRAVYAILGNAEVTDEELSSAFIGAEALLNSRPLTYQSANATDIVPLTPSHFLHGELGREAAPTILEEDPHPRTRWRRVQEVVRHFWHRWLREWLPSLATRKKWTSPSRDFVVGDVVIVMNSETVRGHWPLGRIVAVYPGGDGHVRVADVQVGKTVLKRPIAVLCPLEFHN